MMGLQGPPDPWQSREVKEWSARVERDLIPMVRDSAVTMALVSETEPDVKQAVELGMMLLLGKPLIVAVETGSKVPDGLARAADRIIEVDLRNDRLGSARRVSNAIEELRAALK